MRLLRRISSDVFEGENIDLFLTVLASIGVAIANIFGFAPESLVNSITLAVLGLLALSAIRNRYDFDEVRSKLGQTPSNHFLDDFPADYKSRLETSKILLLTGVSLTKTFATYYSLFEQKARRGDKIRFLFVYPSRPSLEMAVSRALWETNPKVLQTKIQSSLDAAYPENIEIRAVKNPLSYSAVLIDNDTPNATIYIEHYPYKRSGPPRHVFYKTLMNGIHILRMKSWRFGRMVLNGHTKRRISFGLWSKAIQ